MNTWFLAAGIWARIVTLIHIFLGGTKIARPLLNSSDMGSQAKFTNYMCWHMVTTTLAVMSIGFIYAAFVPSGFDIAIVMIILAVLEVIVNLGMIFYFKLKFKTHPQFVFFILMAGLGISGLFAI